MEIYVKIGKKNQNGEISRKITLLWSVFGRLRYIFRNAGIPTCHKRKVYKTCTLLVATYILEKAALIEKYVNSMKVFQKSTFEISLRQKIRNKKYANK